MATDKTDEQDNLVTIRMTSGNNTFAVRGQMFRKNDDQGNPVDYRVEPNIADQLCDQEDSRFRRVDEDGDVVPNEHDTAREEAAEKDRAARTVKTPPKATKTGTGPTITKTHDDGKPNKATITVKKAGEKTADKKADDTDEAVEA